MTARDVRQRIPSAAAAMSALQRISAGQTVRLEVGGRSDDLPAPVRTVRRGSHQFVTIAGIAAVAAMLGIVALAVTSSEPAPQHPAPAVTTVSVAREPDVSPALRGDSNPARPRLTRGQHGSAGCDREPAVPGSERTETYSIHVPNGVEGPSPLVVLLHDFGNDHHEFMLKSGFIELSEAHRFVVVAPTPSKADALLKGAGLWNDPADRIRALVQKTEDYYCIDTSRIFIVGHGRGAGCRLECQRTQRAAMVNHQISILPPRSGGSSSTSQTDREKPTSPTTRSSKATKKRGPDEDRAESEANDRT